MELNNKIIKHNDFYYPVKDNVMWHYLFENNRPSEPERIAKYCKNKRLCLQAGGNVGVYPIWFSKIFERVITCEPESLNFECLRLNIKDYPNIVACNVALGAENGNISLIIDENNCGGHNLGKNIQSGDIPMLKIDTLVSDLELEYIDLIALDIEGIEILALEGARETIKRYSPVIVSEIVWCDPSVILRELEYNMVENIDGNGIFIKE